MELNDYCRTANLILGAMLGNTPFDEITTNSR